MNLKYIIISIIIGLFFPLISFSQNLSDDKKKELITLYNQSQDYLGQGNYDKAIELKKELFNNSKNLDPTSKKLFGGLSAYDLAQIYSTIKNDLHQYIYWLNQAELCDFPGAAGLLGDAYLTGKYGVSQDFQKAKYYYEKSDEGRCKWNLATMYSKDGEFGRNDREWLKYTNQAVEKNDPDAQFVLGICYLSGEIVNKDIDKGINLIKAAAQQNHIKAIKFIEEYNIK